MNFLNGRGLGALDPSSYTTTAQLQQQLATSNGSTLDPSTYVTTAQLSPYQPAPVAAIQPYAGGIPNVSVKSLVVLGGAALIGWYLWKRVNG